MIASKGTIQNFFFYNFLTATRTVSKWSDYSVQLICYTSSAYHVQHVVCTWYEETGHLSSLTEFKSHLLELNFIGWNNQLIKEGRKPEYPEKTHDDELKKMPHAKAWKFKPQLKLKPAP